VGEVRIGVVGLGWWACQTHIPNLLKMAEARVVALCSRSRENIEGGREALGPDAKPQTFTDYGELLASDAVDAVVICTPNHTHGEMALAAVHAGKHVLVEKPLALEPATCRAIADEAARRGVVVQVGLELRYSDVVGVMRRLVAEGAIGEPAFLRCDILRQWGAPGAWRADADKSGGLFHELGVHYVDLLTFLVDATPEWVSAAGGSKATGRDLDYASAVFGFAGGAVARLGLCLFAAGGGNDIPVEVIGTGGRLRGEITGGSLTLIPRDGEPQDHSPKRTDDTVHGFPGSRESLASFLQCVQTGARPSADATVGELMCRACEAARRSVATGGQRTPI